MDDLDLNGGGKKHRRKIEPRCQQDICETQFQLLVRLIQGAAKENLAFYKVC